MKRKELTKIFMMISNWKKTFDLHGLYKNTNVCLIRWMNVIRFIFTASTDPKESSQVHQVLMCWRPEDLGSVGHRHQGDQGTFAIVYIFNPSPAEYLFIYHSIQAAISNAIPSLKPRQIFIFLKYRHLSVEFILPTDHFSKNILYNAFAFHWV